MSKRAAFSFPSPPVYKVMTAEPPSQPILKARALVGDHEELSRDGRDEEGSWGCKILRLGIIKLTHGAARRRAVLENADYSGALPTASSAMPILLAPCQYQRSGPSL
jgi:hypothetical protein